MKTLSKKVWKRWEVRAMDLEGGERIFFGRTDTFFFRSSAERLCKNLNMLRLRQGYRDWTFHVHDRREDV